MKWCEMVMLMVSCLVLVDLNEINSFLRVEHFVFVYVCVRIAFCLILFRYIRRFFAGWFFFLFFQSFCFLDRSIITFFFVANRLHTIRIREFKFISFSFDLFTQLVFCGKSQNRWKQWQPGSLVLNFSTYSSIFIHGNVCWQIFYAIKGEKKWMWRKAIAYKKMCNTTISCKIEKVYARRHCTNCK